MNRDWRAAMVNHAASAKSLKHDCFFFFPRCETDGNFHAEHGKESCKRWNELLLLPKLSWIKVNDLQLNYIML